MAKPSTDGGGSETVTDDFFLASKQEVGLGAENSIAEGALLAVFTSDNSSRLCACTATAISNSNYSSNPTTTANWLWLLRSPNAGNSYCARSVDTVGSEGSYNASYGYPGPAPAL